MSKFYNIEFSYTDAEEELRYKPELINNAYVDLSHILKNLDNPSKFLVIGPKGSGKTALSTKLQLMSDSDALLFVSNDLLENFEFNLINKFAQDKASNQLGGLITIWQVLLILRLVPLLLEDEKLKHDNPKLEKFNKQLQSFGLTSSGNLTKIVQITSRRGVYSNIKKAIFELKSEKIDEKQLKIKDPAALLDTLKIVFDDLQESDSRYYLILDGLDYVLRDGKNNLNYLRDLIVAARDLNNTFYQKNIQAKVIILMRNEVISLIPDPNLTKRVTDNGIIINWYDNVRDPLETNLFKIIEKRAGLAGYRIDISLLWKEWFPPQINRENSYHFILKNTRHLPRDLISFFREMQKIESALPFSEKVVLAALNNYSQWFLGELKDALLGLVDDSIRTELAHILSSIGKRQFSYSELESQLMEYGVTKSKALQISRELFNTSWIGNTFKITGSKLRYNWKYRKQDLSLNIKEDILIHNGLLKALNLI